MLSELKEHALILHSNLGGGGGGEHYPGMCHRWVGVTPFSISTRGDKFCSFLSGDLSSRRGAMVSPVASAICIVRESMGRGEILCGGGGGGGGVLDHVP